MKIQTIFFCFFSTILFSQDGYHQSLLDHLSIEYGLDGGSFIFGDSEEAYFNNAYEYGNINVTDEEVENRDFTRSKNVLVNQAGANAWEAGMGINTTQSVSAEDLILITFWAKHNSNNSQVFAFAEESIDFEKQYYFPLEFTPDWTQYFIAFKSTVSFNVGRLQTGFHFASMPQDIDIAGFTGINYKNEYGLEDLPSSFSPFDYEGSEEDAPWRVLAASRIESLRKADLEIIVVDQDGDPIENAEVTIEMQQHDFGFGSALVTCRFPGNNCYDETYVDKVLDLDGRGHGFNECVNENALKWRGWEQEWLGTPEETVGAFEWLSDQGITMRGHNLIWPGSDYLPQDILDNLGDIDYLRNRMHARIDEMITHPTLSTVVRDWDVLNEITTNRTLEQSFNNDPSLENGRKIYNEIYARVKELDPSLEMYINDYVVISDGSAGVVARYKSFLDELKEDDVPFDGIGFQCHIGSVPTSIPKIEQIFNDFYQRYGKRMKVTEYDINPSVDEATQANYMRDLLTLTFSHPGMDAFIMWGFWDGNHWKDNAPMYNLDWSLKPSGEVFIEKVFSDWWTDEITSSDSMGKVVFRPFKGEHLVTVNYNGESASANIYLLDDEAITIQIDGVNSVPVLDSSSFKIFPNPVSSNQIVIDYPRKYSSVDIEIYDSTGLKVDFINEVRSQDKINLELVSGKYQLKIMTHDGFILKSLIVL